MLPDGLSRSYMQNKVKYLHGRRSILLGGLGHRKPVGSKSSGQPKNKYNRHRWLPEWDTRYPWARVDCGLVGCLWCIRYPALRHQTKISRGEKKADKITSNDLTNHEKDPCHVACHKQYLIDLGQ